MEIVTVFPLPRNARRWISSGFARQFERFVLADADLARRPLVDNVRRLRHIKIRHLINIKTPNNCMTYEDDSDTSLEKEER